MRKILILGALAAAGLFVSPQSSHAWGNGAWCAKINAAGGVQTERCEFATFEACRRYILGESKSFCVQTQYQPRWNTVIVEPEYRVIRRYHRTW